MTYIIVQFHTPDGRKDIEFHELDGWEWAWGKARSIDWICHKEVKKIRHEYEVAGLVIDRMFLAESI